MKNPLLKVEDLTVYYGYINALKSVTIEVQEGEIISLIGGNGAGKTTMLMSISNLVAKSGGKVYFRDEDITKKAPDKIVKLGISHIPEGRKIFPQLSVYENLIAGTFGAKKKDKATIANMVEQQYAMFPRLKERAKQPGGSLSGGEQQMLAIARGLMMDPQLVMLDEPSLGLAPIIVEEIFNMILKIREQGKTVLLIEQNASMALSIADRGYVLETGSVILTGTGGELLVNPEVKRAYLGA